MMREAMELDQNGRAAEAIAAYKGCYATLASGRCESLCNGASLDGAKLCATTQ
jgi:hypothetical protein